MLNNKMGNEIDFLGEDSADERCSKAVDFAKRKNKKVREMLETIQNGKRGDDTPCNVPPIKCNCCENEDAYGFFDPNEKNITLCSNVATTAELVIETLAHELQHALDDCLSNSNWSCEERACSEIKAADRDGGCRKNGSARKKNETYRECVKRNAAASTSVDKTCSNNGWDAVEKMFKKCFYKR